MDVSRMVTAVTCFMGNDFQQTRNGIVKGFPERFGSSASNKLPLGSGSNAWTNCTQGQIQLQTPQTHKLYIAPFYFSLRVLKAGKIKGPSHQ